MQRYYSQNLSADRLRLCCEIASPRIKRYLAAEIKFVLDRVNPTSVVLELGCGYGRVLQELLTKVKVVFGVDISEDSLRLAREIVGGVPSVHLFLMDAVTMGFRGKQFDVVICIQNGISVFKVDQRELIREAMRVARSGGSVLFSSYSEGFWEDRLNWFRAQSLRGLIGEIDEHSTGGGTIVCKDGFSFTTVGRDDFATLVSSLGVLPRIMEVDQSSIFCEIQVPNERAAST